MRKIIIGLSLILLLAADFSLRHLQATQAEMESEYPTLAWNGADLGVAWSDGRDGNQEIYFRMANIDAARLGPEERLTRSDTFDDHPRLCWTGSEFGLSYIHEGRVQFDLIFQRLDRHGAPLGGPVALVRQAMLGKDTGVCWTGAGFGVVCTQFGADLREGDLVYRFVDDEGKPQGAPVTVASGPGLKVPAALIRSGPNFVIFYLEANTGTVLAQLLDPFGTPKGQPIRLSPPGVRAELPVAAFNGDLFLAAWPQQAAAGRQVIVQPLSPDGKPLGDPMPVTALGPDRPEAAIAAGPDGFGLAWIEIGAEGRMPFFAGLSRDGKIKAGPVRLSQPRPVQIMSHRLALVTDDKGYVLAWPDVSAGMNTEIVLSRIGF